MVSKVLQLRDGRVVSVATINAENVCARAWDVHTGECIAELSVGSSGHVRAPMTCAKELMDGQVLFLSADGFVCMWDIGTGRLCAHKDHQVRIMLHQDNALDVVRYKARHLLGLQHGRVVTMPAVPHPNSQPYLDVWGNNIRRGFITIPIPTRAKERSLIMELQDGRLLVCGSTDTHTLSFSLWW